MSGPVKHFKNIYLQVIVSDPVGAPGTKDRDTYAAGEGERPMKGVNNRRSGEGEGQGPGHRTRSWQGGF